MTTTEPQTATVHSAGGGMPFSRAVTRAFGENRVITMLNGEVDLAAVLPGNDHTDALPVIGTVRVEQ